LYSAGEPEFAGFTKLKEAIGWKIITLSFDEPLGLSQKSDLKFIVIYHFPIQNY
jgi:hypothetical protein